MKKSKIILIAIYIIVAALVLYFAYGVVKNRYFGAGRNSAGTTNSETQNQMGNQSDSQTPDQSANNQENTSPDINNVAPGDGRPNIQNADCDNDCANFKESPDNLKYCQEACGDRPVVPKDSEGQCENLAGIEKDACWRDLAVSKKDIDICDKISDAKLKKVCRSRVTEEVLN
ncbi:MAG: hypothetical protein NT093_02815 [Candidatus Moranbacteria bacterium]|nr:hypothetical protein [Candidatus Moranbacteria bacterium]